MNILFIQPCTLLQGTEARSSFSQRLVAKLNILTPAITFPVLSALTPKHHSITMIDERYEKLDFTQPYDLVGITAMTSEARRAYELADEYRRRGTPVILGGPHVSALPDEAKAHADSVVIGEAEETWPQLLHDLATGSLKPFYYQGHPISPALIPPPDLSLISRFILVGGSQTTRGCPHHCKYCYIGNSKDGKVYRTRPIGTVVHEIRHSPYRTIYLYDSSLTINLEHTKNLFKALRGTRKHYICLGNINILAKDSELLRLSKEAGCIQWNLGFESLSPESLKEANKTTNKIEDYQKAIDNIHAHGMNVLGYFMFGFDHDTKDTFKQTSDFIAQSHLDAAYFSILTPLPGTPFYTELKQQKRLKTKDWSHYGYQETVTFIHKTLTEDEILEGFLQVCNQYYSIDAVAKRFAAQLRRLTLTGFLLFISDNILLYRYHTAGAKTRKRLKKNITKNHRRQDNQRPLT